MKIGMTWRTNKTTRKKKQFTHKDKIRWQQLGLEEPANEIAPVSMEEIRRQVITLSSRGFGQGKRARSAEQETQAPSVNNHPDRKRRRGATE